MIKAFMSVSGSSVLCTKVMGNNHALNYITHHNTHTHSDSHLVLRLYWFFNPDRYNNSMFNNPNIHAKWRRLSTTSSWDGSLNIAIPSACLCRLVCQAHPLPKHSNRVNKGQIFTHFLDKTAVILEDKQRTSLSRSLTCCYHYISLSCKAMFCV